MNHTPNASSNASASASSNGLFPADMLVQHQGGQVYTTSLKVAEHFGKRHDNVIRDIRELLADLPEDFSLLNFEERSYTYTTGKGQARQAALYTMSHDGFALLAMGFTGREALRWKVAFLAAFRQMEKDLHEAQARYAAALDLIAPARGPASCRAGGLRLCPVCRGHGPDCRLWRRLGAGLVRGGRRKLPHAARAKVAPRLFLS